MNDFRRMDESIDEIGCIGNYDPHCEICCKACALSLRCIIEHNRLRRLEQVADLYGLEDIEPTMSQ